MLDKIYNKYIDRLDHDQIKELVLLEIESEIKKQLKMDVGSIINGLSVKQLMEIKAEISSGMKDSESSDNIADVGSTVVYSGGSDGAKKEETRRKSKRR